MLNLPNSKNKLIFYSSLIMTIAYDANENFRKEFRNSVANCIYIYLSFKIHKVFSISDFIFQKIDSLDNELYIRFCNFLAFYMSNLGLEWDFKKWYNS